MNSEENLGVVLVLIVVGVLSCMGGYDCGKDLAKEKLVQELCSKTEYDFCQKVPQAPIYKLKTEK